MNRTRDRSRGDRASGGITPEANQAFSDDALQNGAYTNDALTNKRLFKKSPVKLNGNTVVALFGDSLEQHNLTGAINAGSLELSNWSRGYMNWTNMFGQAGRWINWSDANVTNRLAKGFDWGISGNNTSQMAARTTDITSITGVKVCVVGGGTNDISSTTNSGNAAAVLSLFQSNMTSIKNDLLAAGIKIIFVTIPPRPTTGTGSTGWESGSAGRQVWFDACSFIQGLADADPDNIQVVRRDLICSNADADRTPKTGYLQSDGVHLTPMGGAAVATDSGGLVEALAEWIEPFDEYPAAVTTGDIATNPTCTGTGGTASTGTTGTVCTGMRVQRSAGSTGVTCVASKETIGDIEYQKLVFTSDGTATGGNNATFLLDKSGNITVPLAKAGSWYKGWMQFKADASPLIEGISLRARGQPSTPANMDAQAMKSDTGLLWPNIALEKADGSPLWQSTPETQFKNGTTSVLWAATIIINNQAAGTTTVWISRMQLVPILDPTIEF